MCQKQRPANARERPGQRGNDNEWIEPGLKIDDDQKISQHDRAEQAKAQAGKRIFHGLDLSANRNVAALWQVLFNGLNAILDFISNAAEVAAIHGRVDVDHWL